MAEIIGKMTSKKTAGKVMGASVKQPEKKTAPARKPPVEKAVEERVVPPEAVAPKAAGKKPDASPVEVTAEQRYRMVAEAAYYRAESNQFMSDPVRDWIEAEKDIAAFLSGKQ